MCYLSCQYFFVDSVLFASFILLIKTTRAENNLWCYWYDCTLWIVGIWLLWQFFFLSLWKKSRRQCSLIFVCYDGDGNGQNANFMLTNFSSFQRRPIKYDAIPISICFVFVDKKSILLTFYLLLVTEWIVTALQWRKHHVVSLFFFIAVQYHFLQTFFSSSI